MQHVEELYSTDEYKQRTREFLASEFNYLRSFTKDLFTSFEEKNIVAQGEIISTNMVTNFLLEKGVKVVLLSAFDFMRTDKNAEPDTSQHRLLAQPCLLKRFRFGQTSMVCTITTHV